MTARVPGHPARAGRSGARPSSTGRASTWRRIWRRDRAVLLQLLVLAAVVLADTAVADGLRRTSAADLAAETAPLAPAVVLHRPPVRSAAPVAVAVPRLKISSRLVDLHRRPDGTVQVPRSAAVAGWYVGSAHPGDAGPTVVIGHVDSTTGPGIFHGLRQLRPGDLVMVGRADRTTARFVVRKVERVAKRRFPTAAVYTGRRPSLRLVTCGGVFDRRSGHYRDNVIVYADLVPPAAPAGPRSRTGRSAR